MRRSLHVLIDWMSDTLELPLLLQNDGSHIHPSYICLNVRQEVKLVRDEQGGPPRFEVQPQLSAFDDLWPVMTAFVKSVVTLDKEGTARRRAQTTILSVAGLAAATVLFFLSLLPAGFIHGPTDARTVASRPTYKTKTYINPDKVRGVGRGGEAR